MLDDDVLDAFERALRTAGSPAVDALAPGLTDRQIDAHIEPLGLTMPEEARRWWRWRDGYRVDVWSGARWFAPGRQITSLRTALSNYEHLGGSMEQLFGFASFIRPVSGKPSIYFDCRGALDQPVPVYAAQDIDAPELALPSIGDLIVLWTKLLDDWIWFDAPGHERPGYEDLLPDEVLTLGIH